MYSQKKIKLLLCSFFFCSLCFLSFSQNNALVLNGAYIMLNGGTVGIVRNSGHIISEGDYNFVKWDMGAAAGSYQYPFGYSTTDYLPFTFNKTGGNANLAMSTYYPTGGTNNTPLANTVTNMNPSGPVSDASNMVVDRWWRMQVENGTIAPTANLTFSYRGSENTIAGISCPTDIITAEYWNGSMWVGPGMLPGTGCTSAGTGTTQANGVSVFTTNSSQPFVLTKKTNILPIEIIKFSSICDDGQVIVQWTTASEQNNDFFTVERSPDAVKYISIGIVSGSGN